MKRMTARERILTVLNGGIPDRVPVVPFIQEELLAWAYPYLFAASDFLERQTPLENVTAKLRAAEAEGVY
ncbi:MAG: hypothetical protein PHT98_13260 [Kiritimatiellae bacterium]|jgi:hypothetical protein|nr:hypothetical protein [Kiritimatiellia bacterium]